MEPEVPDELFPGGISPFSGSEPALAGWLPPEDGGGATEELLLRLTANPDEVCGLGGCSSPAPAPEPPRLDDPPSAALYEVVCDLSAPLRGAVVSIQLGPWAPLPPPPLPPTAPPPAPTLRLTEEEKRLLAQEGVTLPSSPPLTPAEERILKKVRRKIRNKRSAQDSRRRKKEYLDGLESRAAACFAQNQELRKKIQELEKHNGSLLRQLRALVEQTSGKAAQTGACVLILLLSLGLILSPSYSPFRRGTGGSGDGDRPAGVISRNILTRGEPAGEAPFPEPGWLWGEEPGPTDGAEGGHGDGGPAPPSNASGWAPAGDGGAGKQGHGDEM